MYNEAEREDLDFGKIRDDSCWKVGDNKIVSLDSSINVVCCTDELGVKYRDVSNCSCWMKGLGSSVKSSRAESSEETTDSTSSVSSCSWVGKGVDSVDICSTKVLESDSNAKHATAVVIDEREACDFEVGNVVIGGGNGFVIGNSEADWI